MTIDHLDGVSRAAISVGVTEPVPPAGRSAVSSALLTHLRDPMRRSSYALIVGTGLTSGLGLLFWALAARWLPEDTVGLGAAMVSAITLLANFSTLGLRNGLVRFLPAAGPQSRRLIAMSYGLCAVAAVLLATVFLIGQPLWAARLGFLRTTPVTAVVFVAAVAVWVIFILQDNVLLAQRRAIWVPVANGVCSVAKIILLPLLAGSALWAIFTATVLPAVAAVIVITALVLRRPRTAPAPTEPVALGRLVRFAATDHLSALLYLGTTDILTLVILQALGPEASAYYFIATTIGYSLYLITSNVGSALLAEGARYPDRTVTLARQAVVNAARLVVPAAVAGCLLAPLVLGLLGASYAANGTVLLQLILISAVPQIIVSVAMSTARLRQDLSLIILIYAAQSVGILGGSYLLVGRWGLSGVGFASLATATLIATVLLVTGRTGLLAEHQAGGPLARLITPVLQLGAARRRRGARRELRRRLPGALAALELPAESTGTLLNSDSDSLIFALDDPDEPRVLKIATSAAASTGLDRHAAALDRLAALELPASLTALVPTILRRAAVDGHRVLLESQLPGAPVAEPDESATDAAYAVLTRVHDATKRSRVVDAELIRDWIGEPLDQLRGCAALARRRHALEAIEVELTRALGGRAIATSTSHGDFWPGNTLISNTGAAPTVTGLVDWENARAISLPATDLVHWWLSTQPGELGAVARSLLLHPETISTRLAALHPALEELTTAGVAPEHLILLTWLWHVGDGLRRASRNGVGRIWLHRNVLPVLAAVEQRAGTDRATPQDRR